MNDVALSALISRPNCVDLYQEFHYYFSVVIIIKTKLFCKQSDMQS